jgi:hypothetical protein
MTHYMLEALSSWGSFYINNIVKMCLLQPINTRSEGGNNTRSEETHIYNQLQWSGPQHSEHLLTSLRHGQGSPDFANSTKHRKLNASRN